MGALQEMAVQEKNEVVNANPSPTKEADVDREVFYYRPLWFVAP